MDEKYNNNKEPIELSFRDKLVSAGWVNKYGEKINQHEYRTVPANIQHKANNLVLLDVICSCNNQIRTHTHISNVPNKFECKRCGQRYEIPELEFIQVVKKKTEDA